MIRTTLALVLAMFPGATKACAVHEPLQFSDFAYDPVVLRGTVSGYAWDNWQATFIVTVTEVMAGKAPAQITVFWSAQMAEMAPETWERPDEVIIGLALPEQGGDWTLIVPICGDAHLVADTTQNWRAISISMGNIR